MFKQPEMGCHLLFYWVCDPLDGNLREWKGIYLCMVCKTTHINLMLQACKDFFVRLALLVSRGGFMYCSNLGTNMFHI